MRKHAEKGVETANAGIFTHGVACQLVDWKTCF
jgi:hypothetical protein